MTAPDAQRKPDPQQKEAAPPRRRPLTFVLAALGVLALAVPLILRLFVYEPFKVPAGSMRPTLLIGDHFFLDRTTRDAALGDVIVFEYPENRSQQFVKRVVARGGDTIESFSGRLVLNGEAVPLCAIGVYTLGDMRGHLYLEKLTGRGHLILLSDPLKSCQRDADCGIASKCGGGYCGYSRGPHTLRANEVWVAGDNRNNSHDSFSWAGGAGQGVPLDAVRGRVGPIWWEADTARARIGTQINGPPRLPADAPASLREALNRCLQGA